MLVLTSQSDTSASATEVAQSGSSHRRSTSASQPWPSRSKAFFRVGQRDCRYPAQEVRCGVARSL
eukprot:1263421-Lingulodinium_polyedra.AAC.1